MTDLAITFAPFLPWWSIAVLALAGAVFAGAGLAVGASGSALRLAAAAILTVALSNPSVTSEEREPLTDVAVLLIDESPSQSLADRAIQTEQAAAELTARLERPGRSLETRTVRLRHGAVEDAADGTRIMTPLREALADVPARRIAGAIVVTDGQVHDLEPFGDGEQAEGAETRAAPFPAPIHVLLSGQRGEADRRLTVIESPSFGLVGETAALQVQVDDPTTPGAEVRVTIKVDGAFIRPVRATVGEPARIEVPVDHRGATIVELAVREGPQEITLDNNRAVVTINGVRDRLRVLLVSGEPHPGERTWRNLLKSDPSVDLVHFTILRPPEKQDGTPIHELSLIAFPTRELFEVNSTNSIWLSSTGSGGAACCPRST